jgi:hypothetical protein
VRAIQRDAAQRTTLDRAYDEALAIRRRNAEIDSE